MPPPSAAPTATNVGLRAFLLLTTVFMLFTCPCTANHPMLTRLQLWFLGMDSVSCPCVRHNRLVRCFSSTKGAIHQRQSTCRTTSSQQENDEEAGAGNGVRSLSILSCDKLRHLLQPNWVTFTKAEKAEWLNATLRAVWQQAKTATEDTLKASLGPVLDYYKPNFLKVITRTSVTTGVTVALVIRVQHLRSR